MDVRKYLRERGIEFKEFEHEAVFTVEEADRLGVYENIKGMHSKNLFLKDRKSKRFYLVVMPANKSLDMEELGEKVGERLKFANEENLWKFLKLKPGSVSPFGLINDSGAGVKLIVDREIWDADFVSFHPNINTETLELSKENFHKYVNSLENEWEIVEQ